MSTTITITRLRPGHLYQLQQQTGNAAAAITDCIRGMQATYAGNLNTACPTCSGTGRVAATAAGLQYKAICPTCAGYLLYNTTGGQLAPPVNPFQGAISVAGCLPADLLEALTGFPAAATLAAMITALQGNTACPVTNDCPTCSATGCITLWGQVCICPTCAGWQQTTRPYQLVSGRASLAQSAAQPPNPLPTPPPIPIVIS